MLNDEQLRQLGHSVKSLRLAAGLTQTEVAERLGNATVSSISKLENGNMGRQPRVGILLQLAEMFNCKLTDLIQENSHGSTENSQS